MPELYLSRGQVEGRLGLAYGAASRLDLPEPDAVIGPINADGSIPRGTTRGWKPATIDKWNATRQTRIERRVNRPDD